MERIMTGKKVIVTGGSRGIGAETVRLFAKRGCRVAFLYRNAAECAAKLSSETGAEAIRADLSVRTEAMEGMKRAVELLCGADVLVCNAGIAQSRLFTDITEEDWQTMLGVNLSAPFYCTQAILPTMIHRKEGRIVFVSSMWGQTGASCEVHYSAAKAGLIGMTRALAKELGPSGITVNCVAPGVIDTDMNRMLDAETVQGLREETPLGRIGTPEDIAEAIWYLSSDAASFVTGQVLAVNGGFVMQ